MKQRRKPRGFPLNLSAVSEEILWKLAEGPEESVKNPSQKAEKISLPTVEASVFHILSTFNSHDFHINST